MPQSSFRYELFNTGKKGKPKENPKNTTSTYCQIDGEDFVNFCGLLRKHELYK